MYKRMRYNYRMEGRLREKERREIERETQKTVWCIIIRRFKYVYSTTKAIPLIRMVTECGFSTSSTKVYFSSPYIL